MGHGGQKTEQAMVNTLPKRSRSAVRGVEGNNHRALGKQPPISGNLSDTKNSHGNS